MGARDFVMSVGVGLLAVAGCGETASGESGAAGCVPGEQRECACPGGAAPGVQICADDGRRYGMCLGCGLGGGGGSAGSSASSSGSGASNSSSSAGGQGGGGSEPIPGAPSGPPQSVPPAPPPDAYAVVQEVANEHPDWLAGSCVEDGGNNDFLFEVVRRLRLLDDRWGLNWKRGNVGDLSQDVVDYHYGEGVSEESTEVYIIDMIVGHCGDSPQAGWLDVTQATLDANTIGRWTLAGQDL